MGQLDLFEQKRSDVIINKHTKTNVKIKFVLDKDGEAIFGCSRCYYNIEETCPSVLCIGQNSGHFEIDN
jgi:hypothetical protein